MRNIFIKDFGRKVKNISEDYKNKLTTTKQAKQQEKLLIVMEGLYSCYFMHHYCTLGKEENRN